MKDKNIIFSRYLLVLASIVIIIKNLNSENILPIILMLIIIILMQLNLWIINNEKQKFLITLVEVILTFFIARSMPMATFIISSIVAIDVAFLFDDRNAYALFFGLILSNLIILIQNFTDFNFISLIFVVLVFNIFMFVKKEHYNKLTAQDLYDKLRINEEKLKSAYQDLELYAQSIEEITKLKERNRISRDIHDSVGHALSTIIIQLGAIEKLSKDDKRIETLSKNLQEYTKESLDKVRMAVRDLKPEEFKNIDALVLIDNLLNQQRKLTNKEIVFSFSKDRWKLDDDQSTAIYRLVEEFLGNSNKHSEADKVSIVMIYTEDKVKISLKDNGKGTDTIKEGFGLKNIRERISELGGYVEYSSKKDKGFTLTAVIPKIKKYRLNNL